MINVLICDDFTDYAELIGFKIERCLSDLEIESEITKLHSLDELSCYIKTNKVDILFLDIMFGEQSSIDWSIANISDKNIQIIFMTEYPIEAYNISEVNHSYYLIKSRTTDEMIKKAIHRVLTAVSKKSPGLTVIRSGHSNYTVKINDILFIESLNNSIKVHLRDGNAITVYTTMKEYFATLTPNFLRCHKSYVINMNHVFTIRPHYFLLDNNDIVPIPPRKYSQIVEKYNTYLNSF